MSTADDIRQADELAAAAHWFVGSLGSAVRALEGLTEDPTRAAEGLATGDLADAIALLQDLRLQLSLVERDLIAVAGKREGKVVGSLSDGRQFTLERATDRKEWDHEDWKRDVRRALTEEVVAAYGSVPTVIDEEGEIWDLPLAQIVQTALAKSQEVHGSTAPRSRALKSLGLYAGDYATSSPNGWRFAAIKLDHSPTTTTDTEETTTNA